MNKRFPGTNIVRPDKSSQIHRAGWVILNPWQIIENGYVKIENSIIKEVSRKKISSQYSKYDFVDHGSGVLMSPLVNAHTHLELSCFKDRLDMENGFETWVRELINLREKTDTKVIKENARQSVNELYNSGVLYVGEVSTTGITRRIFEQSPLSGVWFQEFLGSEVANEESVLNGAQGELNFSVAGHAPHTTAPSLLKLKKKQTNLKNLPFSIHVSESDAEMEFIKTGKGKWADFLKTRGIDSSSWNLPQQSPVIHLLNHDLLDPLTLMVHVLNPDNKDFEIIAESGAKVCICPRSNMNLHGKLPNLEKMLDIGIKPALGTDSLASCDSLSIFDEMHYIVQNYNNIKPSILIAIATQYGADALGIGDHTGSLEPGKIADMLYIPVQAKTETELLEKITGYEYD
ncbi:MAG: amidohydrolase family protein [Desulfobacteraceae bacterium]|nr:amidohydrolase family protein [Desulfobacteraceae bacterium]